jgi:DNA ligase-1
MRRFCQLFRQLDRSTGSRDRVAALVDHFGSVPREDAAWALHCLLGKQRRRLITARRLRQIALDATGMPEWLLQASHAQVGDSAETIALLVGGRLDPAERYASRPEWCDAIAITDQPLHRWMERILPSLAALPEAEQSLEMQRLWRALSVEEVLVMVKLLTGTFRVGVGPGLVLRALASLSGVEAPELQHRLMGPFEPSAAAWDGLLRPQARGDGPSSRPYPFFLASPLESGRLCDLDPAQWLVEWKWDGIRGQLIRRCGAAFLWSRGEELINGGFPDLMEQALDLPDGLVLDGEVLVWPAGQERPEPFAVLQRRLGRRTPPAALLRSMPAAFVAYDLLESEGVDRREEPLRRRRERLSELLASGLLKALRLSGGLPLSSWNDLEGWREQAREAGAEGLMLKDLASPYGSGRRRGSWWKHKLEPMRLDAVLLYARNGSGRRANLYTDYTFGLWTAADSLEGDGPPSPSRPNQDSAPGDSQAGGGPEQRLVSFASAYSGLSDAEIEELDRWIRRHTSERFGPVRAVVPELVFELAFEGVQRSGRHRSGVAVRFPRISRWRRDKTAAEADTLAAALALIPPT